MFAAIACVGGVVLVLAVAEFLWRKRILQGENQRKFVHISIGVFAASWPWLISWQAIQIIGAVMLLGVLVTRYQKDKKTLHYSGEIRLEGYGDIFFALAIIVCGLLTTQPVFFALAMLHLALADGLAAVVGTNLDKPYPYRVFRQRKSIIGSMTFWFVSFCILAIGILFVSDLIPYASYAILIIALPPILTLLENISGMGLDNIVVPVGVLVALNLV